MAPACGVVRHPVTKIASGYVLLLTGPTQIPPPKLAQYLAPETRLLLLLLVIPCLAAPSILGSTNTHTPSNNRHRIPITNIC